MKTIKNFYNQYVKSDTRLVFGFCGLTLLLGFGFILVNTLTSDFSGNLYLPYRWLLVSPVILALTLLGMYALPHSPRSAFVTKSYGTYFFIFVSLAVLTTGAQYTPFHVIDPLLLKADHAIGFNSLTLIDWTASHPIFHHIFSSAYEALTYELFLVPFVLALLQVEKALNTYFLAVMISFLIGMTFYYFFPSINPQFLLHDPHFTNQQHATFIKFFEIHHHLPVTTQQGGMIAFPSFHVIWAILLTYATKNKKWLLFPMIILNLLVIASTVFLC